MPIAERHVVDLRSGQGVEVDHVGRAGRVIGVGLRAKRADATVGEHDPRPVAESGEVEAPDPGRWVGRLLTTQQGAGEDHGVVALQRPSVEEEVQVGRPRAVFRDEERLFPEAADPAVIVVARDRIDRHRDLADHPERLGDDRLGRRGRVEEVAGHEHEPRLLFLNDVAEPANALEPLLLDARSLGDVRHAGEGLTELPVGGVDEGDHAG